MSKKKNKRSAKRQVKKALPRFDWQKNKRWVSLLCLGLALALFVTLVLTLGIPVKKATSPNGTISLQTRWKGLGRYVVEYTKVPQGKEVEASFSKVLWFSDVEFTASSRYALFVYRGAKNQQCFFAIDYLTGASGNIDPALIFRTEVPNRKDATDIKITLQGMDPEFDAAIFRVDYTMANGEEHYEHITYQLNTEHLQ